MAYYLHTAVNSGKLQKVIEAFDKKENINSRNVSGLTPLMKAASRGYVKIVRELLKRGANINARTSYGSTALMEAAYHGKNAVVAELLRHRPNINARTQTGGTALMKAAYAGHHGVVEALLNHGATMEGVTNEKSLRPGVRKALNNHRIDTWLHSNFARSLPIELRREIERSMRRNNV